jgi:hypothetical protein
VPLLRLRRAAPGRMLRGGTHAKLSRGLARAAQRAAERDQCVVASLLLTMASSDLRAASGRTKRLGAALHLSDINVEVLGAAKAVQECRDRASTRTAERKETT